MQNSLFFQTVRRAFSPVKTHATKLARGKHVRREEIDSRGWWFHIELSQSLAGSKLRLSPLSEGYKSCEAVRDKNSNSGGSIS